MLHCIYHPKKETRVVDTDEFFKMLKEGWYKHPLEAQKERQNHGLQQTMQGWMITDINAAATVYRSQPLNDKTLTLTSSAACTVDLVVF